MYVVKHGDMIVAAKSIFLYQQVVLAFAVAFFFALVVLGGSSSSFGHTFCFCGAGVCFHSCFCLWVPLGQVVGPGVPAISGPCGLSTWFCCMPKP